MAEMFDVKELVRVGVEDERTGVTFYTAASKKAKDGKLRKTFEELAEQERHHLKRFQEMLDDLGDFRAPERYGGEYAAYLTALTTDRAFPDEAAAVRTLGEADGDRDIVEMSIRFERDTLMLMKEMRALVPERDRPIVDQLAAEEQNHLVTLHDAKDKLRK